MKRELKFRGVYNGILVYGNFIKCNVQGRELFQIDNGDFDEHRVYEVQPETVGQFTGLHDKDGKEIYEGDIVRILYSDWGSKTDDDPRTFEQYLKDIASIGIVEFINSSWEVFFKSERHEYLDGHSSIYPGKHGYIEVIGNIYQNPELINQ